MGLQPILRKRWTKKGKPCVALVWPRFKWFYLYAFVHPGTGRTHWLIMPRVDHKAFQYALNDFAKHYVKPGEVEVVLVLDNAAYHTTKKLEWPAGLHGIFLPAYSPELQPAERLWRVVDEPFVNRSFQTIEEMENVAVQSCRAVMKNTSHIKGLTNYHWWPVDRGLKGACFQA